MRELVKMKMNNSSRAIAALAVMAGVLLLAPLVSSLPTGIGGSSIQTAGCNCHNGASDSGVVADIQGFPEQYNASETYSLSISSVSYTHLTLPTNREV